jgi:hypothetical protein
MLDVTVVLLEALSSVVLSQNLDPVGALEEDESKGPLSPAV